MIELISDRVDMPNIIFVACLGLVSVLSPGSRSYVVGPVGEGGWAVLAKQFKSYCRFTFGFVPEMSEFRRRQRFIVMKSSKGKKLRILYCGLLVWLPEIVILTVGRTSGDAAPSLPPEEGGVKPRTIFWKRSGLYPVLY